MILVGCFICVLVVMVSVFNWYLWRGPHVSYFPPPPERSAVVDEFGLPRVKSYPPMPPVKPPRSE